MLPHFRVHLASNEHICRCTMVPPPAQPTTSPDCGKRGLFTFSRGRLKCISPAPNAYKIALKASSLTLGDFARFCGLGRETTRLPSRQEKRAEAGRPRESTRGLKANWGQFENMIGYCISCFRAFPVWTTGRVSTLYISETLCVGLLACGQSVIA